MANLEQLAPFIRKWEGGFSNHPDDPGGATMQGVTLATFRRFYGDDKTAEDLRRITVEQWNNIFRVGFWDKFKADKIDSQRVANMCVDWCWMSGPGVIRKVQAVVGVKADGVVGSQTLQAINTTPESTLFSRLYDVRKAYYEQIVRNRPKSKVFLKGWMNRLNAITKL